MRRHPLENRGFSSASQRGQLQARNVERARRSLELVLLDKKVVAMLGGPDKIAEILRALADAIGEKKPKKRGERRAA